MFSHMTCIIAASMVVCIQQEIDYVAVHGEFVFFILGELRVYIGMCRNSQGLASVEDSLTHQAAGTITQLLLAHVIAWQILLTRW